jgi:type I restriction enzyme, S subunit
MSYPAYEEMKDSGIEWIGDVPQHWEPVRFKFVAAFYGGGTPSKDNASYWKGDIPWVSPKDMKSRVIYDSEDHISEEALKDSATRLIEGSGANAESG